MAGILAGGFVVSATLPSLALEVGMVPRLAGEAEMGPTAVFGGWAPEVLGVE